MENKAPLYNRIGGAEAIAAAADLFYEKVVGDPLLSEFFDGVNMPQQSVKMVAFMAWAFDGPSEYRGKDLRSAHAHLVRDHGLNDKHFDAVAVHLISTLQELGVDQPLIDEAVAIVASTRNEVLDR